MLACFELSSSLPLGILHRKLVLADSTWPSGQDRQRRGVGEQFVGRRTGLLPRRRRALYPSGVRGQRQERSAVPLPPLKIALQLVERALEEGMPFRATVADSFFGEDRTLRQKLRTLGRRM
jgi:hypothetical protein